VHGRRRISADTALRLARYFGTSERLWMNLQGRYDLEIERDRLVSVLNEIPPTRQRLTTTGASSVLTLILTCYDEDTARAHHQYLVLASRYLA
jgi:hypothetical protein